MIELFFIGVGLGCFGYFLEFCLGEGNILGWYREWLDKSSLPSYIKKPIGACIICTGAWVTLGACILLGFQSVLPYVIILGISEATLMVLMNLDWFIYNRR